MNPQEVFMARFTMMCLLVAANAAGCANLSFPRMAGGYCSTASVRSCPEPDGDGNCQRCPTSAVRPAGGHFSSNTLAQRLP